MNQEGSAQCTEKASNEGGARNPYTIFAETGNGKVCLITNKDTTWVIDSEATDNLV
jgi:hypothetical protein